jgi:hypothetical protein
MVEEFRVEDVPGTVEYERKQLRLLKEQESLAPAPVAEPEPEPVSKWRRKAPAEEVAPEVESTVEEAAPVADSEEA